MKIKTTLLAVACAALLIQLPIKAAVTLDYDNDTGDYALVGSDDGPGSLFAGFPLYLWDFTAASINLIEFQTIFNDIINSPGFSGTVNGDAITGGSAASSGQLVGIRVATNSSQLGVLGFPNQTGTIDPGLWSVGAGTFIGAPQAGSLGPTTSNVTINVTAVPEPSTFAALAGLLALGFVACRHRMRK